MAIVSPSLALAIVILFALTRINQKNFTFERLFFFGLLYCQEPSHGQIAAIAETGTVDVSSHISVNKGKKKQSKPKLLPRPNAADPVKLSVLPVVRKHVGQDLFLGQTELPKSIEFVHTLGMTFSYFMSYLAEDCFLCVFPNSKVVASQIQWFAALILVMGLWELSAMTIAVSSLRAWLAISVISGVVSLAALANGDAQSFFLLRTAFINLKSWAEFQLIEGFSVSEQSAQYYSSRLVLSARVITGLFAGLFAGGMAVSARRFARYDYDLYERYRRDDAEDTDDPYALRKPSHWLILALALDHMLPPLALSFFIVDRSRRPNHEFPPVFIMALTVLMLFRLALGRARFQTYLDGAVNAFRDFEKERPSGVREAGRRARIRILSTHYFLPTVGLMYICGPIMVVMLVLTAKRSGNILFGFCRGPAEKPSVQLYDSAREVMGFLAWFALCIHSITSALSLALDAVISYVEPSSRKAETGGGRILSSSTRRRLRRMQQDMQS